MKIIYDPEADTLNIIFSNAPVAKTDREKPNVILEYDKEGRFVCLEILNASQNIDKTWSDRLEITLNKDFPGLTGLPSDANHSSLLDWEEASAEEIISQLRANR